MLQKLKIAISPCPNDTFIFENLYLQKVELANIEFDWTFADIDVLNNLAKQGDHDIIKISSANYHLVSDQYVLLECGGAIGYGVGPLVVSSQGSDINYADNCQVAIPGINTTANFLFSYFYPKIRTNQKIVLPFDQIEAWVAEQRDRYGVLIHEGRFTYKKKGLKMIADLGSLWENKLGLPIPLGCIVAKKSLGESTIKTISEAITLSISNYDKDGKPIISNFIRSHAQEMEDDVIMKHINLYVNDYSKHMGVEGLQAFESMQDCMDTLDLSITK
jgi:1,4-dihydroxy-6-naphthoate synthase